MHRMSEKLGNYLDKETEEDCTHHCYQGSMIRIFYKNDLS